MSIFIYHGDDNFKSRRELTNALKDYPQIKHFQGKDITAENITQASGGLFSRGNTGLVLENFFGLPKKQLDETAEYIKKLDETVDFFIWQDKRLYPNQLNKLPGSKKVKEFKLPNTIFKLLDSIGIGDAKQLLGYLQASFQTHPPELIFFLIQQRLRQMILAKENSQYLSGADWQKRKLYTQVKNISSDLISFWYTETIEREWKMKTGRLGREIKDDLVNLMIFFNRE